MIFQIACEKFAAAEKSPKERNNQAAAEMIKVRLFLKLNYLVPNYLAATYYLSLFLCSISTNIYDIYVDKYLYKTYSF